MAKLYEGDRLLVGELEVADTPRSRTKGLLGRKAFPQGSGMLLVGCWSIHTFFLTFQIDIVYLTGRMEVARVVSRMAPWRLSASLRAEHVLELPAGDAARLGIAGGMLLRVEDRGDGDEG